jgi:eukaryotic-like serine/threonine-protein kinase
MDLQPGTWVTQTVRLERRIATGGMAELWQGEHDTLGVKVAVKCLLPRLARRDGALSRFLREAQVAARLNGPHTVRVHDCVVRDTSEGEPSACIVMELLEGEDLGHRLVRSGRLSLDETVTVVGQVASALDAAHAMRIVHRDVKPENIFLESRAGSLQVKLLDFGVASDLRSARTLTASGLTVGTPPYMSPEQLQGIRGVDGRSDVWSLAVVAYACLVGGMPFEGRTLAAIGAAIREGMPQPPSSRRGDLPPSIDAVFARAFDPSIDSRFRRASDLADALQDARRRPLRAVGEPRPVLPVPINGGARGPVASHVSHSRLSEPCAADRRTVCGLLPRA